MTTVAIIGVGELGATVSQSIALRDCVQRVVIIDDAASAATGVALDIQQSGPVERFHTTLTGTDDLSAVTGTAVCVVADRAGGESREWSGDEGLAMIQRLLQYSPSAPIVFAGTQQVALMQHAARELRAPRERLIGSAAEALASAIRSIVALEAQCSTADVALSVLGTPPDGFVVPWNDASIGGYALERTLSQAQIARLEARSARLWPPGPFTLATAAARIVEAIVGVGRNSLAALTPLDGEFGVRNQVAALPVFLAQHGIARVRVPELNTRERVRLETVLKG